MINFANLALNLSEILNVTTAVVGADTPVVVSVIPGGVSQQTSGYIALGEVGLSIVDQVLNAIVAAHTAKVAAAAAAPPAAAPPAPVVSAPAAP